MQIRCCYSEEFRLLSFEEVALFHLATAFALEEMCVLSFLCWCSWQLGVAPTEVQSWMKYKEYLLEFLC